MRIKFEELMLGDYTSLVEFDNNCDAIPNGKMGFLLALLPSVRSDLRGRQGKSKEKKPSIVGILDTRDIECMITSFSAEFCMSHLRQSSIEIAVSVTRNDTLEELRGRHAGHFVALG